MGVQEVTLLVVLMQFAQATGAFLKKASPGVTNPWGKAACVVGQQLADHVAQGAQMGLVAANAEFAVSNSQEKTFIAQLGTIPPIT